MSQCGEKISKQLLCKVVRSTENIQAKLKILQPYEEAVATFILRCKRRSASKHKVSKVVDRLRTESPKCPNVVRADAFHH